MEIGWDTMRERDWEAFADDGLAGLQQRWQYGEAVRVIGGHVARVAVRDGGDLRATAQVVRRGMAGLITRGPIWQNGLDDVAKAVIWAGLRAALRRNGLRFLAVTSAGDQAPGLQIMTPATLAVLDIAPPDRRRLRGKWRNRLCRAEASYLTVAQRGRRFETLRWLIEADLAQQKSRGYRSLPPAFTAAWKRGAKKGVLMLEAGSKADPIAAMLFLCHGSTATYHIGWSDDRGRAAHAHNLIIWRAIELLAKRGVRSLDLGTLDTVNAPGLARFKLGTGAEPLRLGPTTLSL